MLLYDLFLKYDHATGDDGEQKYACCPFHSEKTPSFTVNERTHEWYCHGCARGGAESEFLSLYYDVSLKVAKAVFTTWERKGTIMFPTEEYVEECHKALLRSSKDIEALHTYGITDETIEKYHLGFSEFRITFPIKSRTGCYVNIRKYMPPFRRVGSDKTPKCINIKNLGEVRYYPYEAFDDPSNTVYIVEGEKDCLAARSQGINAVTSTGGSSIPTSELVLLKGKDVILMLDTDQTGRTNTNKYIGLLRAAAHSITAVTLPCKDYSDFYQKFGAADVMQYAVEVTNFDEMPNEVVAQDISLVRSEFTENLNTWIRLRGMSVVGVEPRIYTVPTRLRAICRNSKCSRPCPLAITGNDESLQTIDVDPRQMLQFVDTSDNNQDTYLRKVFGCKSVVAEPVDVINVQKIIFQESASFIDGLDESTFDSRYGIFMYTDYRLSATMKYDFEACRVTDPRSQQNYYVIRNAESVTAVRPSIHADTLMYFRNMANQCETAIELLNAHYQEWLPALGIEGRADLFGAFLLTYASVTEIPWQTGLIKGWLDIMVIGDTRTGKSQMAQRFIKMLGMGSYINGENARRTGVIGGVQRFGDSWVITWGAIPMNDRGLLMIDEASGLEIDDVKDLSSTRSSGAVTLNKIVKGEARARTRLIWLSNPRSGRNLSDFYWKGYGAFQEYIPVAEDQARYDVVLTAAREDIDVLEGVDSEMLPDFDKYSSLFSVAWLIESCEIVFPKDFKQQIREKAKALNDDFGGGPIIVGVAVHEKLLRLTCAFAVLCGDIYDGALKLSTRHLQFADQFLRWTLAKQSFGYSDYIKELKRSQNKRGENVTYIRGIVGLNPALKAILSSSGFKGIQFREVLGMDQDESAKILSALITKGLIRLAANNTYVPDKLLMDIAKEMEV